MFQQLLLFTLLVPTALAMDVPLPCRCAVPGLPGYLAVVIGVDASYMAGHLRIGQIHISLKQYHCMATVLMQAEQLA